MNKKMKDLLGQRSLTGGSPELYGSGPTTRTLLRINRARRSVSIFLPSPDFLHSSHKPIACVVNHLMRAGSQSDLYSSQTLTHETVGERSKSERRNWTWLRGKERTNLLVIESLLTLSSLFNEVLLCILIWRSRESKQTEVCYKPKNYMTTVGKQLLRYNIIYNISDLKLAGATEWRQNSSQRST